MVAGTPAMAMRPWPGRLPDPAPASAHVVLAGGEGSPLLLPSAERERADRFRFAEDRRSFIRAHTLLRLLLGQLLGTAPSEVPIAADAQGKPRLAGGSGPHFNLSHTRAAAAVAITAATPIGIDIELVRPLDDMEAIARDNFAAAETAAILGLPPGRRQDAFFSCWTRKEAVVKALGDGLSRPLSSFEVTVAGPARLLRLDGRHARNWTLAALPAVTGHHGALACPAPLRDIQVWSLDLPWAGAGHADPAEALAHPQPPVCEP